MSKIEPSGNSGELPAQTTEADLCACIGGSTHGTADPAIRRCDLCGGTVPTDPATVEFVAAQTTLASEVLIPVSLTLARWKRLASCLDWHGKDHESELIVDAIREQTGDV